MKSSPRSPQLEKARSQQQRPNPAKKTKQNKDPNNTNKQHDLVDIYSSLLSTTAEYTFFSTAHGIFTKIDYILGYKICLNKLKELKSHKVCFGTIMDLN